MFHKILCDISCILFLSTDVYCGLSHPCISSGFSKQILKRCDHPDPFSTLYPHFSSMYQFDHVILLHQTIQCLRVNLGQNFSCCAGSGRTFITVLIPMDQDAASLNLSFCLLLCQDVLSPYQI